MTVGLGWCPEPVSCSLCDSEAAEAMTYTLTTPEGEPICSVCCSRSNAVLLTIVNGALVGCSILDPVNRVEWVDTLIESLGVVRDHVLGNLIVERATS